MDAQSSALANLYLGLVGYPAWIVMTFQVWVATIPVAVLAFATFFHLTNWTLYVTTMKNVKIMVVYVILAITLALHFPPFTLLILEDDAAADAGADAGADATTAN